MNPPRKQPEPDIIDAVSKMHDERRTNEVSERNDYLPRASPRGPKKRDDRRVTQYRFARIKQKTVEGGEVEKRTLLQKTVSPGQMIQTVDGAQYRIAASGTLRRVKREATVKRGRVHDRHPDGRKMTKRERVEKQRQLATKEGAEP